MNNKNKPENHANIKKEHFHFCSFCLKIDVCGPELQGYHIFSTKSALIRNAFGFLVQTPRNVLSQCTFLWKKVTKVSRLVYLLNKEEIWNTKVYLSYLFRLK